MLGPDLGPRHLNFGSWDLDLPSWDKDHAIRTLGLGSWDLDLGSWDLDLRFLDLHVGSWVLVPSHRVGAFHRYRNNITHNTQGRCKACFRAGVRQEPDHCGNNCVPKPSPGL